MGRERKRADIVILDNNNSPSVVIEVKQEFDKFTLKQLDSYVAITRASFGVAVSPDQFHCFDNTGAICDDLPIFGDKPKKERQHFINKPIDSNVQKLPFEIDAFERISSTHAKVSINGQNAILLNTELVSYRKVHKHFLAKGVILEPEVKQQDWCSIITKFFNSSTIKEQPEWVWILKEVLSAISANRYLYPFKYENIDIDGQQEKCLLIRLGHIVEQISQTSELHDRRSASPIKSAQALRKQLLDSGVILKQDIERIIAAKRVAHLAALSILKLENFDPGKY